MTFEQLFYFSEVYRLKSISSAAESLHISRQCLSKSILKLEKELNVTLFERSAAGVNATSAAKKLYQHTTLILNEYAAIKKEMIDCSSICDEQSSLTLSVVESIFSVFGEQIIDDISAMFPDKHFDLRIVKLENLSHNYDEHDIIFFPTLLQIDRSKKYNDRYQVDFMFQKPVHIWVKNDHPLLQMPKLDINTLKNYPFCMLRNTLSATTFTKRFNYNYDATVNTRKAFKEKIRNGYYTIDIPFFKNNLFFSEIFNTDDFVPVITDELANYYLIYKKGIDRHYIDYLKVYFQS